jgi:adenine-specific DNA-methyltransferase
MWSALYPYLGGKRRLCPLIFREIDRVVPHRLWSGLTFLDAFLGGGSVALYARAQGFKVIATDIAERAIIVGSALIENSRVKLTREDILKLAAPTDDPPGRVELEYSPKVFTRAQGRFLDRALAVASRTADPAKAALYRLLAIRVALKAHPMSQVRAGTIHRLETGEVESITESCLYHYVDGMRLTRPDKLWDLAQQINAGVFEGEGRVIRGDILDLLPTIQADIVYFDPPYAGTLAHEREYRVLDEILEGASLPVSPFSAKDGVSMLDELLNRAAHIPAWVLSFGNAVTEIGELEAKMKARGRCTRAVAVHYMHKESVASEVKKALNQEFVVVGWDPEAALLRRSVGLGLTESAADQVVALHVDAHLRGAEGSAPGPLAGDGFEQSDATKSEESAADGREAVAELQPGVDQPNTVLGEASLDGHSERTIG